MADLGSSKVFGDLTVTGEIKNQALEGTLDGKVGTGDTRLTNSREWTAETVAQVEAEAGTSTVRRAWTAQRVRQAINAVVDAIGNATTTAKGWMSPEDKSKLDSIESGATGDQTAQEILDLVKTVDGDTSGLDADLLDGQHGSYYSDYNNLANKPSIPAAAANATITLSAGGGMSGGGNFTTNQATAETITFSHADTSSAASVNNSGNTFIQDITVDTYGHITAMTSATASSSAPTAAQVGSATAGLGAGAVGSYAFMQNLSGSTDSAGSTSAGSQLQYASIANGGKTGSGSASGTWRCMGYTPNGYVSVYLRIS